VPRELENLSRLATADGDCARAPVKHYTVAEAKLPADALRNLPVPLDAVAICADLDKNVFYAEHTDPTVAEALRDTHWYEVREWTTTGPGTDSPA